jgi:hypothetical protein
VFGDVGAPHTIRSAGDEPALHKIVMDRSRSVPPLAAVTDTAPIHHSQQPRDALAANPDTHPQPQLAVHPWSAVGAA